MVKTIYGFTLRNGEGDSPHIQSYIEKEKKKMHAPSGIKVGEDGLASGAQVSERSDEQILPLKYAVITTGFPKKTV